MPGPVQKQARVKVTERITKGKVITGTFLEDVRTSINLLSQGIAPPKQLDAPADAEEQSTGGNAPETARTISTITLEITDPDDPETVVGEVDIERIETITFNVPGLGLVTFSLDND